MAGLVHVVVGAGLPNYFRNCVKSCLVNTSDDVIAIYNRISETDAPDFEDIIEEWSSRIHLIEQENSLSESSRTGSLYRAYNLAIEMSLGKYDWIHFLQGDMQVIRWNESVLDTLGDIFERSDCNDKPDEKIFCVGVYAPSIGATGNSTKNYTSSNRSDLLFFPSRAMVDSGIFSLARIEDHSFRFHGEEWEVDAELKSRGYRLAFFREPLTSFIPWPAVVRRGKVIGKEPAVRRSTNSSNQDHRFLLKNHPANESDRTSVPLEIVWAEDWVVPDGWTCFFPYWYTDLSTFDHVKRRVRTCRELGVSFFSVTGDYDSRTLAGFFRRVSPYSGPAFLTILIFRIFREMARLSLKRIWKCLAPGRIAPHDMK